MITIGNILDYFEKKGLEIISNKADINQEIIGPRTILEAKENQITFLTGKFEQHLSSLFAQANFKLIIVEERLYKKIEHEALLTNIAIVISKNPKLDLIDSINHFFVKKNLKAFIHPSAVIADNVSLGEKNVIGPNVVIEQDVVIGDRCMIEANAVVKSGSLIGNDVIIKACAVIGGSGFGYAKNESGGYELIPHLGKVIIEDDVHIGSNTCIDRGSLSDTVLKKGVRIDNLVHIAHNVKIGRNSLVIACSMIAGSVEIGDDCWVAPSASVRNNIKINSNSVVGLGSVVTKDVGEGVTVAGVPAMDLESFKILSEFQKEILKSRKGDK